MPSPANWAAMTPEERLRRTASACSNARWIEEAVQHTPRELAEDLATILDERDALRALLTETRTHAVQRWLSDAASWGFALTWPEAVERYGVPDHIAKIDAALATAKKDPS